MPSADEISHFADTAKAFSGGKITIKPQWHADGDGHLDWDQQVAAMVQKGDLDLALGPTWAWDVLGVNTFQPLQSPFLVDSDALVAAIITDDQLSARLMTGMPAAQVVGLSLWPEGLRHPFGFDHPLVTPAAYQGKTVRSPKSDATTNILTALGATTTPEDPDATRMAGLVSEYALSPNGIGAADITLFPKINVLYANADSYATLDDAAKRVLGAAAADTQQWAIDRTDDVAAGKAFCTDGGTLVLAGNDAVSALQAATRPVAKNIEKAYPGVVAAITTLKADHPVRPDRRRLRPRSGRRQLARTRSRRGRTQRHLPIHHYP